MRRRVVRLLKGLRAAAGVNFAATRGMRALRRLGMPCDWAVRHLHPVGQVHSLLPNGRALRLWTRGDDWVSNQLFWHGWAGYESETVKVFYCLAQTSAAIVDVGAFVGYYSILAARANPAARIVSIEPLPSVYQRLTMNVALNGVTNVECVNAAAGRLQGTAAFFHPSHELPSSSSLSIEFMSDVDDLRETTVRVVAIDDLLAELGIRRVDLVKIDTESTEPDVLVGMMGTLRRDRPWIICEVLRSRGAEDRLNELLSDLGYTFYLLTADGPSPRPRIEGHPEYLNYLFSGRGGISLM